MSIECVVWGPSRPGKKWTLFKAVPMSGRVASLRYFWAALGPRDKAPPTMRVAGCKWVLDSTLKPPALRLREGWPHDEPVASVVIYKRVTDAKCGPYS